MSERWLEIYEDFYKATESVRPPAPILAILVAMSKRIAALEAEVVRLRGVSFSDRNYGAMRSRANAAEKALAVHHRGLVGAACSVCGTLLAPLRPEDIAREASHE